MHLGFDNIGIEVRSLSLGLKEIVAAFSDSATKGGKPVCALGVRLGLFPTHTAKCKGREL